MKKNTNSSQTFSKNDLVFYYQVYKFPTELISQDVAKIGDLIFCLDSLEPENGQTIKKKIKLANSFIIEDEIESKKGLAKKGKISQPQKNKIENQFWRRTEPDDPGFFDDFKGKSDERQVLTFKRNLELIEKQEMSISIEKSQLYDHLELKDKEFFEVRKKSNKSEKLKEIIINREDQDTNNQNTNHNSNSDNANLHQQQQKEITATADDLFSEDGLFSNFGNNNKTGNNILKILIFINNWF